MGQVHTHPDGNPHISARQRQRGLLCSFVRGCAAQLPATRIAPTGQRSRRDSGHQVLTGCVDLECGQLDCTGS
jgi:hypothetical protein